jgi:succinyl-CoA synthetase alpha subunit
VAILVHQGTRVLIQGITGNQGRYHTQKMKDYNVRVVAGSAPGKGGQQVLGVPVYDSVAEAAAHHPIDASMILVPPAGVLSAAVKAPSPWW